MNMQGMYHYERVSRNVESIFVKAIKKEICKESIKRMSRKESIKKEI